MTIWRYYVAVLATLAVVGIGWVGWEQHRQAEQQIEQTCLARAAAYNANVSNLLEHLLTGVDRGQKESLIGDNDRRIQAC